MGLFDRFRRRGSGRAGGEPSAAALQDLRTFIDTREGVEAYVEPPTAVYAMTLCLVAADGEFRRQPVRNIKQARALCNERGIPLYDARIVGYPKRMRDYERGLRSRSVQLDDLPPLEVVDEPRRNRDD